MMNLPMYFMTPVKYLLTDMYGGPRGFCALHGNLLQPETELVTILLFYGVAILHYLLKQFNWSKGGFTFLKVRFFFTNVMLKLIQLLINC